MNDEVKINLPIQDFEVPDLRQSVGWDRRDSDFPALLGRCNFWAGVRNEAHKLIAFGYVAGRGFSTVTWRISWYIRITTAEESGRLWCRACWKRRTERDLRS